MSTSCSLKSVRISIPDCDWKLQLILLLVTAKTIPFDTITPKPAGVAQQNRRDAAQDGNRVNLGEGQQVKKGGCC